MGFTPEERLLSGELASLARGQAFFDRYGRQGHDDISIQIGGSELQKCHQSMMYMSGSPELCRRR